MVFLALTSPEQLQAARNWLDVASPGCFYADEIKWILSQEGLDPARITARLRERSPRYRKIAVVAAVRIARRDSEPLRNAASSEDDEVAQFARDMLECIDLS